MLIVFKLPSAFGLARGTILFLLKPALLCVFFLLGPSFAYAQSANQPLTAEEALQKLAVRANGIQGIKSNFTQSKYVSFMDEKLESSGFFVFNAPQELIWQYTNPVNTGLKYKDGQATMWASIDSASSNSSLPEPPEQASRVEEAIAQTIANHIIPWVSFDVSSLLETYNITVTSSDPLALSLMPKKLVPGSPIKHFEVFFANNGIDVKSILLYEQDGDYTQIVFYNTEHVKN